jgi:hypothetical protein
VRVIERCLVLGIALIAACTSASEHPIPTDAVPSRKVPSIEDEPPPDFVIGSSCPGYDPPGPGELCGNQNALSTRVGDGTCEYGHDLDRRCNDVLTCAGATWSFRPKNPCYGRCPSSFAGITPGESCADPSAGCAYTEGTCACVQDPAPGGGASTASHWICARPPAAGCPAQRPSVGSDCVREMTCDYGSCTIKRDVTFACEGGTWIQSNTVWCGTP